MASKKLVRKDVIRLARQKLWTDIGKALDSYEKHVYGDLALMSTRAHKKTSIDAGILDAAIRVGIDLDPDATLSEVRPGDISSVEEIEKILPPEPPKRRGTRAKKPSPVSDHIRQVVHEEDDETEGRGVPSDRPSPPHGLLGTSEEKVLVLIVQSAGGMTPAQIAIKVALKKRTIQNILTSLKSMRYIIKDANHGKFRATEEGKTAVKGRYIELAKGAILEKLSDSERKVLFAIASKKEGVTLSAISVMVPGITKRTKQNIITKLKTLELIEKNEDRFALTEYAREELKGKLAKPLTGKTLRDHLGETLPETQAIVLDVLFTSDAEAMSLSQIAHVLNGRCAFRTVQNIMTALKAQELVSKRDDGCFELAPTLRGM
jgi:predicted transcriptional regulator